MLTGTVHIVDDDAALRTALVRLCASAGLRASGHADASSLLADPGLDRPACILLDVRLADDNGLDVQARFRAFGTTIPIVFLTGYGTIPITVRAMRGGAVEFLTKPADDEAILDAVARALTLDAAAQAAQIAQAGLASRLASLTGRERDVFDLAIGGLMNKQIAAELGVSEITAKVHKRRVMEKMEARSLADLVRMAGELGTDAPRQR